MEVKNDKGGLTMTKIYLIRHAEAEGNYYRRAQGIYDANVTPLGRKQIADLAERFRAVPLDALYSSDLVRTRSTATAITKYHPALTVKLDPRLREIGIGIWEDHPWGDLIRDWPEQMGYFSVDPIRYRITGCELYADMQSRMERVMTDIARENEGKTIAVVSHGTVIRGFLCRLMGIGSADIHRLPHGDNTAVHCLTWENGRFTIEYCNDNSHLADEHSTFRRQTWWRREAGSYGDEDNATFEPVDLDTDADLYADAYAATWMQSHGNLNGYNEMIYLAMAKKHADEDPRLLVKLLRSGEFAGLIELDKKRDPEAGWISLIYMKPEYRDRRLGVQLLGHAVSYFRELGFEKIRLHVSQTNTAAIGFYEYNDFVKIASVPGVGGELWRMEMDIRPRVWTLP